ncbi:hypothetical protein E2986_12587 [Frieseomelitta varia]|uniref:RRM domain-containing protein n=1 Tax=Frieseomelitta varia TaxID=561572 RepID=A0A833SF39_9HYME|nr:hypothetical protein E2986_12587 [Frieseomelitta varia]
MKKRYMLVNLHPAKKRGKELKEEAKLFTNVYVKNFGEDMTDDRLREMFEKYGTIASQKVMIRDDGKSRGFAEGKCMLDGRKRRQPTQELKRKFEQLKLERLNRYRGVNL